MNTNELFPPKPEPTPRARALAEAIWTLNNIPGTLKVGEVYEGLRFDEETAAILTLFPMFEFPDWEHRTIAEMLKVAARIYGRAF